jgi:hypothetical protein
MPALATPVGALAAIAAGRLSDSGSALRRSYALQRSPESMHPWRLPC